MLSKRFTIVMLLVALFSLEGCVAPPPRQRVVYHEGSDNYDTGSGRYCHSCGTVRDIDQVEMRQGNSGGGAVLGAIIGGAVVGNNVEENNARAASGYAWRFRVELDDGRWATVTQYENPGFHPGDRVVVRRDHLEYMR